MSERTSLGALLKRYRVAAGFSQETLAARAGVSARAVSDLERGVHRAPHGSTLDMLATALDLSSQRRALLLAAAHPEAAVATQPYEATPAPGLPQPPNALIGREHERDLAAELLRVGRLLTITGAGGVGKTRLALQVAGDVSDSFVDGVAFVDLAPLRDAALVPGAIAQALGLREQANRLPAEQVWERLQGKRALLVLDNFEHLLEAAPFVADSLARLPRLAFLVTSRAPLRLRAERLLPLAPLTLEDALILFRERAQAVRPDGVYPAVVVGAICEQVDCLPLGIELAAAQVGTLSLPQLTGGLMRRLVASRGGARDLPDRQRTMETAIGWSYDLLTEGQQECFQALAVFAGGWTLEAAVAVLWPSGADTAADSEVDIVLALAALVDASLIKMAEVGSRTRFHMLGVMRDYALERLRTTSKEEEIRRRHAEYYASLAETAVMFGPGRKAGDPRLDDELPNARAALEWAEWRQAADLGLRLAGFARLWHIRGQTREAVYWQQRMLALDTRARERGAPATPLTLRVARLYGLARTLLSYGDLAWAEDLVTDAIDLGRSIGDHSGVSQAFATLGSIAQANGALDQAVIALAESHAHAKLAGDTDLRHRALTQLAELARLQGDLERAYGLLNEALGVARDSGNQWDVATILTLQGHLAYQQRQYTQARARYAESLPLFGSFDTPTFTAWALEGVATTLCAEGSHAQGVRLCAGAAGLRKAADTPPPPAEREVIEDIMANARHALGEPTFRAEWAAGSALTREGLVAEALSSARAGRERRSGERMKKGGDVVS